MLCFAPLWAVCAGSAASQQLKDHALDPVSQQPPQPSERALRHSFDPFIATRSCALEEQAPRYGSSLLSDMPSWVCARGHPYALGGGGGINQLRTGASGAGCLIYSLVSGPSGRSSLRTWQPASPHDATSYDDIWETAMSAMLPGCEVHVIDSTLSAEGAAALTRASGALTGRHIAYHRWVQTSGQSSWESMREMMGKLGHLGREIDFLKVGDAPFCRYAIDS